LAATGWTIPLEILDLVATTGLWRHVSIEIADALAWAALLHFALVFPRPRPLLTRHPSLVGLVYAAPFVVHSVWLAAELPTASDPLERVRLWVSPIVLVELVYPVAVITALIHGYWSINDAIARQHLRWLGFTLGMGLSLYLGIWVVPTNAVGHPLLPWGSEFIVFLPAPVAMAAAILRYQAFDIKVVINQTLCMGSSPSV
jgi:two-component system NarL family sensor kinase